MGIIIADLDYRPRQRGMTGQLAQGGVMTTSVRVLKSSAGVTFNGSLDGTVDATYGAPGWWLNQAGTPRVPAYVRMTPDLASLFLENFKVNRRLDLRHVASLRRDIEAGRWDPDIDALVVDGITGHSLDGQHRATAIRDAGIVVLVKLEAMTPEQVAKKSTVIRVRTTPDAIRLAGGSVAAAPGLQKATSIATLWLRYEAGEVETFGVRPTALEVAELLESRPVILEVASRYRHLAPTNMLIAPYLVVLALALHHNREAAEEFADGVKTGANLRDGDPRLTLRNRWLRMRANNERSHARMAMSIKAWNAFVLGRSLSVLKWIDSEPFPEMVYGK